MWDFLKPNKEEPETVAEIDLSSLEQKLLSDGFDNESVSKIVNTLHDELITQVEEKTVLTYDDIFGFVEKSIDSLYMRASNKIAQAKHLKEFIEQNPEIGGSVKLYASYIVYGAADIQLDEYKVVLSGQDTQKVEQAQQLIDQFNRKSKIKRYLYLIAKDVVALGDAYLEKIRDDQGKLIGVGYLPAETVYPIVDSKGVIQYFYQIPRVNNPEGLNQKVVYEYYTQNKALKFEPDEVIHFNDGSVVGFNDSPINNLLVQCRFLKLLEESILIHRVTRARRFILFFLDVTGKTKKEIRTAITKFTNTVKKIFNLNIDQGQIERERALMPSVSDLVIPITKGSETKVQTIPSDPSATKIDDLKFYTNRITTTLLTSHVFSPERTGKEDFVQQAFFRLVRIYQKQLSFALQDVYRELLDDYGFDDIEVSILFPSPDPSVELKIVDTVVRRMMVVNQLIATTGVVPPNRWIVEYVFKDMTMLEVKQLINMLDYAQKQQNQTAEGNEYPSLFQQGEQEAQPEESAQTESEQPEKQENPFSNLSDQLVNALYSNSQPVIEQTKDQGSSVTSFLDRSNKVIELAMKYLEQKK